MTDAERTLLDGLLLRLQKVRYGRVVVRFTMRDFTLADWEIRKQRERMNIENSRGEE